MRFTVTWIPTAEQQLAALWLAAGDKQQINRASEAIHRELARRPDELGDLVFDTVRAVKFEPLGVEFEVLEADRRVFVLSVWDATRDRPNPTGH